MINQIKDIPAVKQTVKTTLKKRISCASSPTTIRSKSVYATGQDTVLLHNDYNTGFCQKYWNKVKNFWKKLKPVQYIPQDYKMAENEEIVNATLDNYFQYCNKAKGNKAIRLRKRMQPKLRKFYLEEAKTIEKIFTKNKAFIEKIDKDYQKALDEIMTNIDKSLPEEEKIKAYLEQKIKIDTQFGNQFLDIIAKEYNMSEIKPTLQFYSEESRLRGDWNAAKGKIRINSNKIVSSKDLICTLLHEYTHFRQDVGIYTLFGKDGFRKMIIIRYYALMDPIFRQNKSFRDILFKFIMCELEINPVYQNLEKYIEKHPYIKSANRKLARLNFSENIHYKSGRTNPMEEYLGQICEMHARHNGDNYGAELFQKLFPEYARIKKPINS